MYFYLLLFNFSSFLLNKLYTDCRRFFFNLFHFSYDESNCLYCIFCFSLFLPKLIDLLGKQRQNNGL